MNAYSVPAFQLPPFDESKLQRHLTLLQLQNEADVAFKFTVRPDFTACQVLAVWHLIKQECLRAAEAFNGHKRS